MKYLLIFALLINACTEKKSVSTQQPTGAPNAIKPKALIKTRMLSSSDIKTGPNYSTPVISAAQKFIIPVPTLGKAGELLLYPAETSKSGQPILDYQGNPIGERGIVFFNRKDQSWQAATGDGRSVIIINEVTQLQADKLYQKIRQLQPTPTALSLSQLKEILLYAQQELGLNDMYNSTRSFVQKKMTSVDSRISKKINFDDVYGFKKRDDREVNQAIYIPGSFLFKGPAASSQKFIDGGVIIEQQGAMRGVQPEIFMRTYTLASGHPVQSLECDIKIQHRQ